ncbi:hypothetical protein GCM10010441_04870 [Kitasatospora paracochleata]|uniref:Phosphotransferase family enzyme n=1 Tax=Kitasatospora paracochleata TaxID=58354 RepID=A0ABT1J9U7_9ACTN|nr:hypothetical protein [Kitasatospora paracochleata]MCP2313816.1 hypothetical protein [Kitasatospora paracochleata]
METITRPVEHALGTLLSDPVDLGGSRRSTVLRCRTADGDTVIVKAFDPEPDTLRGFTAEAAGLSLGLAGPELLAVLPHAPRPTLVMRDLGTAPTLADLLLGDDPEAVRAGLLAWARGLGRLGAGSVDSRERFDRLVARYATERPIWAEASWIADDAERLPPLLEAAGLTVPAGLADELARIGTAGGDRYPAFTPGDTCPDNNLITPDGLRLIDFETCGYQSVFLTAAYCRMPFSTCWCVFDLPEDLAREAEHAYRTEIVGHYPDLAQDAVWEAGMRQAAVVWTVDITVRLLPLSVEDRPMHRTRRPVGTVRQLLTHRWRKAAGLTEYPAFAATMDLLLTRIAAAWDNPPLPGYPALTVARPER